MTDSEALSRLLDGELPPAEAEALRARIDAEPALHALWTRMQALPDALASLPLHAPPPHLDPLPRRDHRLLPWVAAAAALFALFVWSRPVPTQVLVQGSTWVDGTAAVLAGSHHVAVEGRALISVEPPDALLREPSGTPEIASMNSTHLVAALAGAALTVLVYEGRAVVTSADAGAEPVVVEAGETHTSEPVVRRVVRREAPGSTSEPASPALLQARIAELEGQLAAARLGGRMAQARVEAHEGAPQPWPEDLPPAWAPAAFESTLRAAIDAEGMAAQLLSIDCSEFPCLALIEADPEASEDARFDDVKALIDRLKGNEELGEAAAMLQGMVTRDDEGDHAVAGLALAPPERLDPELQSRLNYRLREAGEDARDSDPSEEDENVETR